MDIKSAILLEEMTCSRPEEAWRHTRVRGILLFLSLVYTCYGTIGNCIRTHTDSEYAVFFLQYGMVFLWLVLLMTFGYSTVTLRTSLCRFGFTLRWGGVVSMAIASIVTVYQCLSGNCSLADVEPWLPFKAMGALMEELVYRMLLVNVLLSYFSRKRYRVLLALSVSALLFVIPHVPTKDIGMLIGLFLTSMVMGYVYYKSRSILIPAWLHVVANTSWFGGILMIFVYVVVAALGRFVISPLQRRNALSPPAAPW
jgi:membrane protease YdiL (CAAX protease family)